MENMTQEVYEQKLAAVRLTYGDSDREMSAKRDQALAALAVESGWTQRRLAEVEKVTQQSIDYRLRFGRSVTFLTTSGCQDGSEEERRMQNILKTLTERKFRSYWNKTDKALSEEERFAQVRSMLLDDSVQQHDKRNYRKIAVALKHACGDGKWYSLITIKKILPDISPDDLRYVLDLMCHQGLYKVYGEKHKAGNSWNYRLVVHEGTRIKHLDVFLKELQPILDELEVEGQKNQATAVPAAVAQLHFRLKKLIEKLAQ